MSDDWNEIEETEPQWTSEFDDSEWKSLFTPVPLVTPSSRVETDWFKEIIYCMKTGQVDAMQKRLSMLSQEQLQLFFSLFPTEEEIIEEEMIKEEMLRKENDEDSDDENEQKDD